MRPLEHRTGGVLGESFPDGSVTASVTGDGTPIPFAPSASDLDRGDVLAGRFQIEAVIGTGGSGRVLRAFDRESRMLVALKILRQELAGEAVWAERFARELRVGRAISHPNVCRVFDIGEADGHRFLSMELATGGSLRADVPKVDAWQAARRDRPARAWDDKVSDARAIVAGVTALHKAGIVHRDLKPENILRMHDGRLVVTDFGLATDPGSGPGTTIMVGTPSYMAPEVVMGEPATLRSDVWGLGVVLHEIFFGLRPQWKVLGRGYRRFVRPEAARTTVEIAVADLCGRFADDDPLSRPGTAADAGRELEQALKGKRVIQPHTRRRILWGTTALAAAIVLLVVKARFTTSAQASSPAAVDWTTTSVLQPVGTPEDWSKDATTVASFSGRLHCYSSLDHSRKVRVVWGSPRIAEDIDPSTGARSPSPLLPETYRDGCPVLSPHEDSLLYEKRTDTGVHLFVSKTPTGESSKQLVRGTSPSWLPNGQEFIFSPDGSHAAMFSLATGEMTLLREPTGYTGNKEFSGQAVDSAGARVAVRYTTAVFDSLVVIYSLPGLELLGQARLPFSHGPMRFDGESLEFISEGKHGGLEIASVVFDRTGTPVSRNKAIFTSGDLKGVVSESDRGWLFFTSRLRNDLWSETSSGRTRVTEDGESTHGSYSANHDLVYQRHMVDGRQVIFLRTPDGRAVQVTEGPSDVTPAFFPDGKKWLYVAFDKSTIFQCTMSDNRCVALHHDDLVPTFPAISPSGREVAYVALMNNARLRVFSLAHPDGQRDLGPIGASCPLYWTSDTRLWAAMNVSASTITWVEVDVPSGGRTGSELTVPVSTNEECVLPHSLASSATASVAKRAVTLSDFSFALQARRPEPGVDGSSGHPRRN